MKITAKLISNVTHHGWATMKILNSRSLKTDSKKVFENILT